MKATGLFQDILSELEARLNFSAVTTVSADGKWGGWSTDVGNGTFNGLVGMLVIGEADLVTGGLTVTAQRSEAIDFT